jgi:hypothetical protein
MIIFRGQESLSAQVVGHRSSLDNLLTPDHSKQSAMYVAPGSTLLESKVIMAFAEADPVTDSTRVALVTTVRQSQAGEEDWGTIAEEAGPVRRV